MWKKNVNQALCIEQALNTYEQLLDQSEISEETFSLWMTDLSSKIQSGEYEEDSFSIEDFPYSLLHSFSFDEEMDGYGIVVVVVDTHRSLVLDGNHRINTFKKNNSLIRFPVIVIKGHLPSI